MSGLSIGLAFGLAVAGGISGYFMGAIASFYDRKQHPGKFVFGGALAGALLGASVSLFDGSAKVAFDGVRESAAAADCAKLATKDAPVTLARDASGKLVCMPVAKP